MFTPIPHHHVAATYLQRGLVGVIEYVLAVSQHERGLAHTALAQKHNLEPQPLRRSGHLPRGVSQGIG